MTGRPPRAETLPSSGASVWHSPSEQVETFLDLPTLCLLGLVPCLVGALYLVVSRRRPGTAICSAMVSVALALTALGVFSGTMGEPLFVWLPLVGFAGLWAMVAALQLPASQALVEKATLLARTAAFQGVCLLIAGAGLLGWQASSSLSAVEASAGGGRFVEFDSDLLLRPELERVPGQWCVTDQGFPVYPHRVADSDRDRLIKIDEVAYLNSRSLALRVVRTAEPSLDYNCHGWVFASGRFWVRSVRVDDILQHNDYRVVSRPAAGDVVVYRNEEGQVVHTGLVHSISPEGRILVESKWGVLGRYVHLPAQHCYPGTTYSYYHSARGGHLLRGLDGAGPGKEQPQGENLAMRPALAGG